MKKKNYPFFYLILWHGIYQIFNFRFLTQNLLQKCSFGFLYIKTQKKDELSIIWANIYIFSSLKMTLKLWWMDVTQSVNNSTSFCSVFTAHPSSEREGTYIYWNNVKNWIAEHRNLLSSSINVFNIKIKHWIILSRSISNIQHTSLYFKSINEGPCMLARFREEHKKPWRHRILCTKRRERWRESR